MKWIHLGYRGCLEWNSDRGVAVEVVITLTMKMKMKMMLRWMKTKNRQKVIAWVIGHYLKYVVLKLEGQSNHLIIIIIIIIIIIVIIMIMMMMMMMMMTVTVMILILILIMIIIMIIIILCLPLAVFIALMLGHPSKCLKQIIQMKLNRVKNPNWPEANQLAIYKLGRGFELGTTENKSS